MKRASILFILCLLSLSACGIAYNSRKAELLKTAKPVDWGPPPPSGYANIEKNFVLGLLKDPYSAVFKGPSEPQRDIVGKMFSPTPRLAWVSYLAVNAKNGFGGYTGDSYYEFAWINGEIFDVWVRNPGDNIWSEVPISIPLPNEGSTEISYQKVQKIAYLDLQKALNDCEFGIKAKEYLKKLQKKKQSEIDKKRAEYEASKSADTKAELDQFIKKENGELKEVQRDLEVKILKKIKNEVNNISSTNKYALIVPANILDFDESKVSFKKNVQANGLTEDNVLYEKTNCDINIKKIFIKNQGIEDITDEVIDRLNAYKYIDSSSH
ncbi:MAG: hypothetical protein M0Z61_03230 [Nitrospiraceae bacterium]|nr:hypothetical protein [Nitrospiraceae bacterium]